MEATLIFTLHLWKPTLLLRVLNFRKKVLWLSVPELFHCIWEALSDIVNVLVGLVIILLHGSRGGFKLPILCQGINYLKTCFRSCLLFTLLVNSFSYPKMWLCKHKLCTRNVHPWFVGEWMEEFTIGRKESGTVRPNFSVLAAKAKLDREPVKLWKRNLVPIYLGKLCDYFLE